MVHSRSDIFQKSLPQCVQDIDLDPNSLKGSRGDKAKESFTKNSEKIDSISSK